MHFGNLFHSFNTCGNGSAFNPEIVEEKDSLEKNVDNVLAEIVISGKEGKDNSTGIAHMVLKEICNLKRREVDYGN